MKRTMAVLAAAALVALALPGAVLAQGQECSASLTGANEVPAVETEGFGGAGVVIEDTGTTLFYNVQFEDLTGEAVEAHIFLGAEGENALLPMIVLAFDLNGLPSPIEGQFSEDDFIGVLDGPKTFQEALDEIISGNTYVNVHTEENPRGEIRGQLECTATSEGGPGEGEVPETSTDKAPQSPSTPLAVLLLAGLVGLGAWSRRVARHSR